MAGPEIEGALRTRAPTASAWIAVPCDMPLVHGGRPPSNQKKYSQVVKPERWDASESSRSRRSRSEFCVATHFEPSLRQYSATAAARPQFASGWNWIPWPAKCCHRTSSPGKVTRWPAEIRGRRCQNSALRESWRKRTGIREALSLPAVASFDSAIITLASCVRHRPERLARIRSELR